MENKVPYIHDTQVHNLQAPKEIVPILIKMFSPKSVVDVGCGLGTFLHVFKENGVTDVLGIDGPWVNKELVSQHIPLDCFLEKNLEEEITIDRRFDMAICLEVAEHLHKDYASALVSNLTDLSDIVVFSAAIPCQGGQNHINEQWLTYWEELFNTYGYALYDILRPQIWDNPNIFFWYKQNMVVFAKKRSVPDSLQHAMSKPIRNIVHPDLFYLQNNTIVEFQEKIDTLSCELQRLYSGSFPLIAYIKMLKKYAKARLTKNSFNKFCYEKRH